MNMFILHTSMLEMEYVKPIYVTTATEYAISSYGENDSSHAFLPHLQLGCSSKFFSKVNGECSLPQLIFSTIKSGKGRV